MKPDRAPYPAWIYRQSAVLPYRRLGEDLEVLLITSRGRGRWILPKGIVEPGLTAAASAAKEALEEAGVAGETAAASLGSYRHRKWGGTCEVEVFPFRVWSEMDDWAEAGMRRRRWLSLSEAIRRVEDERLRTIIARLPDVARPADELEPADWRRTSMSDPPRLIYLFRHAKASGEGPDLEDLDRPLAPQGELACTTMKRYLAVADIHPDLVLCSTALRARQTVQRVMPALGEPTLVEYDRGLYRAGPRAILNRLRGTAAVASGVMIVGHDPGIQSLALQLTGSGIDPDLARLEKRFPTGALATLVFGGRSWSDLDTGACELHSFVRPRDIRDEHEGKKGVKKNKKNR